MLGGHAAEGWTGGVETEDGKMEDGGAEKGLAERVFLTFQLSKNVFDGHQRPHFGW